MDEHLKQRLVGALVLLSAAVIFLPLIFDGRDEQQTYTDVQIPEEPVVTLDVTKPAIDTEHFEEVREKVEQQRAAIAPSEESLNQAVETVPEPQPPAVAAKEDFRQIRESSGKEPVGIDRLAENYTVQLAAFSSRDNAEKLHKQLLGKDYT
ncbi:MAG: SPOR domain-containing protein, partial [Ketobacteraceae bacterium]|nr:SPOR domain-containing protein [Ketobacteraceae bacterium]